MTDDMRRFKLNRLEDETGVSGMGIIAEGVQFTSGICALVWLTEIHSIIAVYDNIDVINQIHGHDGKTVIEWADGAKITDTGKTGEITDTGKTRELLAEIAYEQWPEDWMYYLFGKGTFNTDGTWTMPSWAVERWKRRMEMSYSELSPEEQDND